MQLTKPHALTIKGQGRCVSLKARKPHAPHLAAGFKPNTAGVEAKTKTCGCSPATPHRESAQKAQAPNSAVQLECVRSRLGAVRHTSPSPLQQGLVSIRSAWHKCDQQPSTATQGSPCSAGGGCTDAGLCVSCGKQECWLLMGVCLCCACPAMISCGADSPVLFVILRACAWAALPTVSQFAEQHPLSHKHSACSADGLPAQGLDMLYT